MNSVSKLNQNHVLSEKEIQDYQLQVDKLKQELGHHLEAFCHSLNIEANIHRVNQEFEQSCRAYLNQPIAIESKETPLSITVKLAISHHFKALLAQAIDHFLTRLAHDVVNESRNLPSNSEVFTGSLPAICHKMILCFSRPDVSLRYIENYKFETITSTNITELNFANLLTKTIEYYGDNFHRYRVWDTRAITLLSLFLFESREYLKPLLDYHNLSYLVAEKSTTQFAHFKHVCTDFWQNYCADPLMDNYTELAFPDSSGVIFAEYLPLNEVNERFWQQLYDLYLNCNQKNQS